MSRICALCLLSSLAATCAFAQYEYRYIEGEAFHRGETQDLRDEGFTSWMAHPSGGKVAVFGRPAGGFLEYDVAGLQAGEYTLQVRCLAHPTTRTRVLWDGRDLGLITHERASTTLAWSKAITLPGIPGAGTAGVPPAVGGTDGAPPAKHVLRLQGSDDTTQWPYIDVILLTNVKDYVPPAQDQDFVSYTTAWPLLEIKGEKETMRIAPLPPLPPPLEGPAISRPAVAELQLLNLSMASPMLGDNAVQLTLRSSRAAVVDVAVMMPFGASYRSESRKQVHLKAGIPEQVALAAPATSAGPSVITVAVGAGKDRLEGKYALEIPPIATVALDEYAYPSTQHAGRWTAALICSPELLPKLTAEVALADEAGKALLKQTLPAQAQLEMPFDLAGLPLGRYTISSQFKLNGQPAQSDSREFIKYAPLAWPAWEPVREAKAVGDTITLNGRPFLARMLYHAPMNDTIVGHGFNVVQCFGSDPNPLPSIQNHLDACQKVGLYGTVALFNNRFFNQGPNFDLARIEEAVLKFKDHPALLCWDLIDEPEGTMKPEAVQAGADLIRRLDPNHFVWVNLCQYPKASDYLASQDLWSYDYYPFPQMTPFDYKARWLNITDRDLLGKKPLGTCLQTYNYNRREQAMPTPDQLRTSAWLHVLHGYKWFGYYSYGDPEPAGCLSRDPLLLSYTRALNTELAQFQDVILAPGPWRDVPMAPATDKLEAREKEVNGKLYVVIVSDSREPSTVTLSPSWANAKRRLLIESEGKAVTGPFTTTTRPEGTQVWELSR